MQPRWHGGPQFLTLVRHGESIGNQADARAHEQGASVLDLEQRDADVPLSETGCTQADALGRWARDPERRPDLVVSSPYRRAAETASRAFADSDVALELDERLRERDLGILDGLTGRGIRERHPEEARRRARLGKFYYQPPSGESWVDVVLRVRSLLRDLACLEERHVWLVTHQAVIMACRYVLEDLDERQVLEISRDQPLPNISLTDYERVDTRWQLRRFADQSVVAETEAAPTREPAPESGSGA